MHFCAPGKGVAEVLPVDDKYAHEVRLLSVPPAAARQAGANQPASPA
jgi:hypothetical protein